jgi:hypothetical protein
MDEIYRTLGRDREAELLGEAERLHRGARLRRSADARQRHGLSVRALVARARLRVRLARGGTTLEPR